MKRYLILQKDMALNNNHILKDCESYKSAMIERSKLSKDGLKGLQIYVHNQKFNQLFT